MVMDDLLHGGSDAYVPEIVAAVSDAALPGGMPGIPQHRHNVFSHSASQGMRNRGKNDSAGAIPFRADGGSTLRALQTAAMNLQPLANARGYFV